MSEGQQNWAGNFTYSAEAYHYPETVEQVQALVTQYDQIKTLGARHSFNKIADSTGHMISLKHFKQPPVLDRERQTVTVSAGAKYGHVSQYLNQAGYALHNMASLPHISVAGACATATHGSGDSNGNLATAVSAVELVTADGTVHVLSREQHGTPFEGMVVGLGGLGVVTKVTLDIIPAFDMRQTVYEQLPVVQLEQHFEDVVSSAYSVSLFTDWQSETINQAWRKERLSDVTEPTLHPHWYDTTPALEKRHPIGRLPADNCTVQMGEQKPWHEVLPHFQMDFTPSHGTELQSEYFVPRHHAVAAIRAITSLRDHITPQIKISEIRTIAADTLWMSPCYKQPSVALHFTWEKNWPAVKTILPLIETALAPFGARPHWGKLFTMPPARLQPLYERLPDFRSLLHQYDPLGKFRNAFLDTYIFD